MESKVPTKPPGCRGIYIAGNPRQNSVPYVCTEYNSYLNTQRKELWCMVLQSNRWYSPGLIYQMICTMFSPLGFGPETLGTGGSGGPSENDTILKYLALRTKILYINNIKYADDYLHPIYPRFVLLQFAN